MKQKSLLAKSLVLAVTGLVLVFGMTVLALNSVSAQNSNSNTGNFSNTDINAGANGGTDSSSGLVHCGNYANDPCTVVDFFNLFIVVTNFGIDLAGIICVVVLIYSGWEMVFAAGNEEAITSAKHRITNAFIGLIIIISAFVLVNFFIFADNEKFRNPIDILTHPLEYITSSTPD